MWLRQRSGKGNFFSEKNSPRLEKSYLNTVFLCAMIIRVSSEKLRSVFRISLQIPFSDLCSALFPISMGRMGQGQTSRASSPSTQHQILTQTLERSSKPLSPPKGPALLLPSLLLLLVPTKLFLPTAAHYSHSQSQSQSHQSQSQTSSSWSSTQPTYCWPFYDTARCSPATKVIIGSLAHKQTTPTPTRGLLLNQPAALFTTFRKIPSERSLHFTSGRFRGFAARCQTDLSLNRFVLPTAGT